jgi:hypothetical protein
MSSPRLSSVLSVGQVALMDLVEELFRQLKLSQMLTRMTVAVEEPEQSRPGSSVSNSTWSLPQGGEILVGDLRTQFHKKPIRSVNPAQEFLRVPYIRRELWGAITIARKASNDLEDLSLGAEEVDHESGDRAGVRSGRPAERWFAETGDLVSEPIVDLLVEEDERVGKPLQFSHDFCSLQTLARVNIIFARLADD